MKTKIELSQENHSKLNKICKHLNTGEESFIKSLISNELENNIYLIDNYVYDKRKKVLINENRVIEFSNLELQLFDLLANNLDNYISNECKLEIKIP